jgi:hypothetical protein
MDLLVPRAPRNSHPDLNPTLNCPNSGQFLINETPPILALCRELLAAGVDPDTATDTYRRTVLRHG